MIQTFHTENNQSLEDYHKRAEEASKEWLRFEKFKDGDILILERFCHANMNYVYHKGKLRFIGEY